MENYSYQNLYLLTTFKDCNFDNNKDMFRVQGSQLILEKCNK